MDELRSLAEIAFGLLFAVGAVFNATYTRTHGAEFYGSWAAGAWWPPARSMFERVVIPNDRVVTIAIIALQVSVAAMILTCGELVVPGLIVGGAFASVAALVSSPRGAVGHLLLAAGMFALALTA